MNISDITAYLESYDSAPVTLMEVCGSHTAAIEKHAIRTLLSKNIRLISGPGCPVCVTPTAYIDKLIELSENDTTVLTFADMLRVPGSSGSLSDAKAKGCSVKMVYSPMEAVSYALSHKDERCVFAAIGFETTAPIYTFMLDEILSNNITNLRFLTAIKTMPAVISELLEKQNNINAFIAPGHVCAVTGADYFLPLAQKYRVPFAVAGFEAKELVIAIYSLVKMLEKGEYSVKNCYTSVVEQEYKKSSFDRLYKYFSVGDAVWRGLGEVKDSALYLKDEYMERFDAGSMSLNRDEIHKKGCICGQILTGEKEPEDCPLFGKVCTISSPVGACMVSQEGTCHSRSQT